PRRLGCAREPRQSALRCQRIEAVGRCGGQGRRVAGRHAAGSILSRMVPSPRPAFARWRLPAPCGVCGTWSRPAGLCVECLRRFAARATRCTRCALRVPPDMALCGVCIRTPPLFERAVTAFDYTFPWDHAIAAFKFRGELQWSAPLAQALATAVRDEHDTVDLVTAVPLADS